MIEKNKILLVGIFREILDLCIDCNREVIGFIDEVHSKKFLNYEYLGNDNDAKRMFSIYKSVPVVICADNPMKRRMLAEYYKDIGFSFCSLVHPSARITNSAILGKANLIHNQVNISANVKTGDFVRLNTFSNIMHDCNIGSYTTVAPNAVILGRVTVEEQCYIGANSTILPDKKVGESSIVGAGAVVTKNVSCNKIVTGNPAVEKK